MLKMFRVPVLLVVASCAFGLAPQVSGQALSATEVPEGLTATDWSSIQAAYEAGRHAAQAIDGGYRARNPGQQWTTSFDGRGFTTTPNAGGWSWGLELAGYGRSGEEHLVAVPQAVTADGPRVAYDWNEKVTEWWVNDGRGLEHGYTLHERPAGTSELTLDLTIRGDLGAVVSGDGRDVHFVDPKGSTVLSYAGLMVFDAEGHVVAARFKSTPAGLRLTVHDQGARYPLTIDPIAQQAYLKASNTGSGDGFGWSVSVSGDAVVVGAFGEDSAATDVDGDQSNNSAEDAGAAYVFVRTGTTWSQQAYLKASNAEEGDEFGRSVAVSSDTVVVGAPGENSAASDVDGDQSDNGAEDAGAAYVFVRTGTTWSQQAYLKASNAEGGDEFGRSVAVSGDTVVIGTPDEDSNATGVNGDQSNNSTQSAGASYVFVRSGTSWSQQAYLKASNAGASDEFGRSVSISDDTVVVGATGEDSSATDVDGNQANDSSTNAGAAYVFVRTGTTWGQQAYLKASNTGAIDRFGQSVSVSADTVVVGAFGEDSSATGIDGDQSDNSAESAGAAYVFVRSGTTWSQQAYLKASNSEGSTVIGMSDQFGWSVSVTGDTVVVGAFGEGSSATGIDGDQSDNSASAAGAAYVFVRSGTSWIQLAYLKASNTDYFDQFGRSVSVSGDTVVVGAFGEDSSATGIDGDQRDNSAESAGAAYVFDLETSTVVVWTYEGCALSGLDGDPFLQGTGTLVAGSSNQVDLSSAAPFAASGLFVALESNPVPFKGGTLKPFPFLPPFIPFILVTNASGTISVPFTMPPGIPTGTEIWVQFAILDAGAINGVALSNAILGVTP